MDTEEIKKRVIEEEAQREAALAKVKKMEAEMEERRRIAAEERMAQNHSQNI